MLEAEQVAARTRLQQLGTTIRIVLGCLAVPALGIALLSWFVYYDAFLPEPEARCGFIYAETFDDGRVLKARRQLIPPALVCTISYPPTGQTTVKTRPHDPVEALAWFVAAHFVLIGAAIVFLRRRRRRGEPSNRN
jgi:hypothetical protein